MSEIIEGVIVGEGDQARPDKPCSRCHFQMHNYCYGKVWSYQFDMQVRCPCCPDVNAVRRTAEQIAREGSEWFPGAEIVTAEPCAGCGGWGSIETPTGDLTKCQQCNTTGYAPLTEHQLLNGMTPWTPTT